MKDYNEIRKEIDWNSEYHSKVKAALLKVKEVFDDQFDYEGKCEETGVEIDWKMEPWASLKDARDEIDKLFIKE